MSDNAVSGDNLRGLAVAFVCGGEIAGFRRGEFDLATRRVKTPRFDTPLVLATDYAALLSERDALRERLRAVEGDAARLRRKYAKALKALGVGRE